ncbi:Bacteriophage tail assembly protein [Syntrophobacter sp. SbD1]|nr:Bacteriophage tail assembly protein [Syntrophobacter sp. SbD1]
MLFAQLLTSIEQKFPRVEVKDCGSLGAWAEKTPVILDGRPFSFNRHEYLVTPYADDHPHMVEIKAAQMGLTTKAMLKTMFTARYRNFRGILYLFPSRTDVTEFAKGRIDPLIEDNPSSLGKWLQDTDSANVKKIWNCFLYLRGMKSRVGLKSIPVDFIVFDEMDEASPSAVDMALERMSHSEFREVLKLSNPTLPDYGIDKAFQETDQRYWLLKCSACGEYTCLEDTFPQCLLEAGGRVIRACRRCQAKLNPSIGEWVARRPSVTERRGYHYSQLFSHYIDPADILHQFRTTNNLTEFYNLKLGMAYVEATNRLSVQEVLTLCGDEGNASSDPGPCSMGVDQGKVLHAVIGKRERQRAGKIVHIGEYEDWEQLDRLMKIFNVSRAVVDALPETRNARAFAERHKGKVFLCYYSEHQKSGYKWNEGDLTVHSNRTESLDASHVEIQFAKIALPRECDIVKEFAQHCANTAKKLEEDDETGSKRYVYVKLGPDHFRHAFNYEAMARHYGAGSLFADCIF